MNRKKKYRRFVLWCLALDLLVMGYMGYSCLDRKIPDEIYVSEKGGRNLRFGKRRTECGRTSEKTVSHF